MLTLTHHLSELLVEGGEAGQLLNLGSDEYENAVYSGMLVDSYKPRPGIPTKAKFHTFWDLLQFRLLAAIDNSALRMPPQVIGEVVDSMWASSEHEPGNCVTIDLYLITEIVEYCLAADSLDLRSEEFKIIPRTAELILAYAVALAAEMNLFYANTGHMANFQSAPYGLARKSSRDF